VLEFETWGVLEAREKGESPRVLSNGYLDFARVPRWISASLVAYLSAGLFLLALTVSSRKGKTGFSDRSGASPVDA
jgi:hypothetical protein